MLSVKEVEAFYWTARLGTLQNAALKLSVSQSALSKRLQNMQRHSDTLLFDRLGNRLVLTQHGDTVFMNAQRVLASLDILQAMQSPASKLERTLRIGVTELTALTWFGSFVKALRKAYPKLNLHPEVDVSATLKEKLLAGSLDIAFIQDFYVDASLTSIKIQSVQYGWFSSPGSFPANRPISLTEIACLPLIEQNAGSGLTELTRAQFASLGIETKYVFGSNSLVALGGLVEAGMGVACLPVRYFEPAKRRKKIVQLRTNPKAPTASYHAVFYPNDYATLGASIADIAAACATA